MHWSRLIDFGGLQSDSWKPSIKVPTLLLWQEFGIPTNFQRKMVSNFQLQLNPLIPWIHRYHLVIPVMVPTPQLFTKSSIKWQNKLPENTRIAWDAPHEKPKWNQRTLQASLMYTIRCELRFDFTFWPPSSYHNQPPAWLQQLPNHHLLDRPLGSTMGPTCRQDRDPMYYNRYWYLSIKCWNACWIITLSSWYAEILGSPLGCCCRRFLVVRLVPLAAMEVQNRSRNNNTTTLSLDPDDLSNMRFAGRFGLDDGSPEATLELRNHMNKVCPKTIIDGMVGIISPKYFIPTSICRPWVPVIRLGELEWVDSW